MLGQANGFSAAHGELSCEGISHSVKIGSVANNRLICKNTALLISEFQFLDFIEGLAR